MYIFLCMASDIIIMKLYNLSFSGGILMNFELNDEILNYLNNAKEETISLAWGIGGSPQLIRWDLKDTLNLFLRFSF